MDAADRAQIEIERAEARRMAAYTPMPQGDGREDCYDCGVRIPIKRRRAMPGCVRCVDCAVLHERRRG